MLFVEDRDEYKGFPCIVVFTKKAVRIGYVGVPVEKFPYIWDKLKNIGFFRYKTHIDAEPDDVDHVWISPSIASLGDTIDIETLKEYYKYASLRVRQKAIGYAIKHTMPKLKKVGPVKKLDYYKDACLKLVDTILELE